MGKFTRIGAAAAAITMAATCAPTAFAAKDTITPTFPSKGNDIFRVSGLDRFQLSVNAAEKLFKDGLEHSGTFILASGDNWPDAVTAAPLSDCLNAPVLLTPGSVLNPAVKEYLAKEYKAGHVQKVIITGGPNTIKQSVVTDLIDAVGLDEAYRTPNITIERINGADRFEVAYNTAADTTACVNGGETATKLDQAKQDLMFAEQAENMYKYWTEKLPELKDKYIKAKAAADAAKAELDALLAKRDALVKQLLPAGSPKDYGYNYDTWADAIAAYKQKSIDAVKKLNNDLAQRSFLTDVLATKQMTTKDLKSTLQQYADAYPKYDAQIKEAAQTFGVSMDTTLEEAIQKANQQIIADEKAVGTTADELTKLLADYAESAAENEVNKKIIESLTKLAPQIAAAQGKYELALAAQVKAAGELAKGQAALGYATQMRPLPGAIVDLTKKVAQARDAVVKNAGNVSAFVATGDVYTDALTAGPAAAMSDGVVLLSQGKTLGTWTKKWFDLSKSQAVGIGGQANAALKSDKAIIFNEVGGMDRYAVAGAVDAKFCKAEAPHAIASGDIYSDALIAGSFIANYDGCLLLSPKDTIPAQLDNSLRRLEKQNVVVVGGPNTITYANVARMGAILNAK